MALGGLLGAPARAGLARLLPTPARGWPTGTFVANLLGAFALGALLQALARRGPDTGRRRRLRLCAGTGLCGAFTTYSTLAVETDLLARDAAGALAVAYPLVSLAAGLLAAAAGLAVAPSGGVLPVDPDLPGPGAGAR